MLIQGHKTGAFIWFVLWGKKETVINMNIYKTSTGLKKWATGEEWKGVPVIRMGKIDFTEAGAFERITWPTREDFLSWYEGKG